MKVVVGICLILVSTLSMAQVTLYYSPEGVTYVESPPARYQLMEGIDVAYKTKNIDESTKEQYRKKAGGLTSYKLDMKNEAAAIWRESQ